MKLLTLLLLLGVTSLTESEVIQSFNGQCPDFFIPNYRTSKKVITPTVFEGAQYKQICQILEEDVGPCRKKSIYRYATLYDTSRRIPVYSAYTFHTKVESPQDHRWKVEPQLDETCSSGNRGMRVATATDKFEKQALNEDYSENYPPYTRGHLFPKSYAADQKQVDSTFTLTNAAPQREDSNNEWAKQVEDPMLKDINNSCTLDKNNSAYIVTGVVPGEKWLPIKRGNRNIDQGVNIPTHFWTAFTCVSKLGRIYRAHLAQQNYPLKNDHFSKFIKYNVTIDQLEMKLTDLYKESLKKERKERFTVFSIPKA
ncbi:hypothetical protein MHYP_G00361810 [Metynnis hypsauchen]